MDSFSEGRRLTLVASIAFSDETLRRLPLKDAFWLLCGRARQQAKSGRLSSSPSIVLTQSGFQDSSAATSTIALPPRQCRGQPLFSPWHQADEAARRQRNLRLRLVFDAKERGILLILQQEIRSGLL